MGNQVNVGLKFTADTGQAKASIQELQSLLNKLALDGASTNSNLLEAKKIQAAAEAAKELSYHLNNAYNAKTGRFDLSSLDKSLKTSGTNITELSTKFLDAGDTGQQAFLKLAQSISQADQPMLKVSNKLQDFAKTLKQTAKYQISNNILRGFQGAIQSAYGYAKDLNASLTDIRIVTGQNAEQMAKFAEQANKAAKALSTTTTDYTKGSLIYFQQGLGDKEVRERTETTIKMANVTGESTSKIADQMTAVWNNFADGSKELSYYADAMVALGAATASSSDEISEGINKFAATAKTVGLSYEYATAALATVTARTRESADVVGNAFKTLFARIQGLNQGDTLDDGTTLNKYSTALDKVGVSIKDASGGLKQMDQILDDLGPKWQTMEQDQKMALAQTVAGVRQYSQFMALMDNYDYFKENVKVAEQSSGTLEKQAEIYAESWEAAQKRVRAAAEGVYQDLIDDKFFISFTNGIADIISGLDAFIDKAGGLKTVIMGVSSFLIANFSSKIPDAIKTLQYNFSLLTGGSQKAYKNILSQMDQASQKQFNLYKTSEGKQGINEDSSAGLAIKQANQLAVAKSKYYNIEDQLSNVEKQSYQIQLQQIEANQKDLEQQAKKNEEIQKTLQLQQQALTNKKIDVNKKTISNGLDLAEEAYSDLQGRKNEKLSQANGQPDQSEKGSIYQKAINDAEIFTNELDEYRRKIGEKYTAIHQEIMQSFSNGEFNSEANPIQLFKNLDFSEPTSEIERMVNAMKGISESGIDGADKINTFKKQLKALSSVIDPAIQEATGLDKVFSILLRKTDSPDKLKGAIQVLEASLKQATIPAEKFEEIIRSWDGKSIDDLIAKFKEAGVSAEDLKTKTEAAEQTTNSFNPEPVIRMSQAFADLAGGVMSFYNVINSFKSIVDAMNNEDLSGWEKFGSIASGLTFMTMSLGSLGKQASTVGKVMPGLIAKLHGTTAAAASAAGATGAAATGMAATGTAATGAVAGVGALATGLGAIIVVAGLVYVALKGLSWLLKTFHDYSLEGKLENITKATEEAKTAAEEAATAYEDLSNVFDSYDSAIDKLKGLEYGTQSFTDALENANEQAWELIRKYNLIKDKDWKIGDNGEIIITQEGKDKSQSEAYSNKLSTQSIANTLALMQSQYKFKVAENKTPYLASNGEVISQDEIIKSLTAGGQSLSQVQKEYKDLIQQYGKDSEKVDSYITGIAQKLYGDKYWDKDTDDTYRDAVQILDNLDTYKSYKNARDQYNRDLETYGGQNVQSILNGNQAYQNSSYKNEIFNKAQEAYSKELETATNNLAKLTDSSKINEEFKKALGDNYQVNANGDVINLSTHQKDDYYSSLTDDQKKQIIADQQASLEVDKQMTALANNLEEVSKNLSQGDKDALSKLQGNNITKEDYQKLKSKNKLSLEDLGFSEEGLAAIEDSPLNEFIDKWLESLQEYLKNYDPSKIDIDAWKQNYSNLQSIAESNKNITAEQYKQLDEVYQQYFAEQLDGTYKLIGAASDFKSLVENIETNKLKESADSYHEQLVQGSQHTSVDQIQNYARDDTKIADKTFLSDMGYDTEGKDLSEIIELTTQAAQQYLQIMNNATELSGALSLTANNVRELDELFKAGEITAEDYNKRLEEFRNTLDEDVDTKQYEQLAESIKSIAENSDDDNIGKFEFSKDLTKDEKALKNVTEQILRYDSAVEDAKANSSSWMKILKSGNLQDISSITKDLANTYEDILDLDAGSLSDGFVQDTKNLELLTQAANGSEEAYDSLAQAAGVDIYTHLGLDTADYFRDLEDVKQAASDANLGNLADIEAGANLDTGNFLNALSGIVDASFSTASAAEAALASMGINAEVIEQPVQSEEVVGNTLIPKPTEVPWTQNPPAGEGALSSGTFAGVEYSTEPVYATKKTNAVALKVVSAHKASGGGIKYNNSSNGGGSKGNKGGGGGGGSSKAPKHADSKSYFDKKRYYTVTNQIEDLQSAYDKLNKAKDRAFGKDRLNQMDKEIAKTDELIDKQNEYLNEIQKNLPNDKDLMVKLYKETMKEFDNAPTIEFDELGNISNFDAIQDAMYDVWDQMAGDYDEDSAKWQEFEKRYEQLEKAIEQYDETHDLLRDQQQELENLTNQKIDLQLEKVQYSIEVQLDVPDSAIKVLEYKIGKIDDDAFNAISAIGLLSQEMDEVNKKIKINRQGLEDVLKLTEGQIKVSDILKGDMSSLYKNGKLVVSLTSDQVDAIKEYRDNLIDLNSELDDLRSNIEDKVMDAFSAWTDKLSKGTSSVEHYGNVLASYKNIIDTIGKDTLGITNNFLNNLAQATVTNAIDQLKSTKDAYDSVLKAKGEAEKALEEAKKNNDKESQKFWEDTLLEINEQVQSFNEEMMSSWENALSTITDQFENTLNNLIDSFNNSVYQMGGGLSGLADDFSRQQDIADTMLDDYQKIYELSKLSRDINKTIDDTDIISGKQKLKKLLGQINGLQEDGNKMSKYDLEYLQKTYDLRLAEIELEEAQRAKNTVRLQKDSEGNWSYIYTQSSDAIDSAQQKYEDALYAMQDLSSNYIDEMSQKLIDTSQEMAEAIANVRVEDFASQEDYYVAIKKIQDSYEDQLRMQENELNKAIKNNKDLYDEDWTNYHNATGYKISDTENFVTSFKDSLLGGLLDSQENSANFSEVIKASADALTNSLKDAATKYFEAIEKAMNAAGTSTKDFANDASESIKKVVDESQKAVTEMDKITNDMDSKFKSLIDSVTGWQKEYSIQLGLMEEANLSLIESFNKLLECLSIDPETGSIKYDVSKAIENKDANNDSNSSSNSSSSSSTAAKYDTGGYTGNWGDAGKLAVLHEKELVLNAEDTANVLTAVQLVRAMLNTIDLNAQQASVGFGQLVASTIRDSNNETLQQDVHIVAEFPNVEDHNEIKEAFNNLINQAAQYANRA